MLDKNDFYDVAIGGGTQGHDGYIDLFNDIIEVIDHYAPAGTEPAYDVWYDRGPKEGPNLWNMTAPDGKIDLFNDIIGVIDHYAPIGNEAEYDVWFDRGPRNGPNPWNMTAPDGKIDLFNDILGVITQVFHDCR